MHVFIVMETRPDNWEPVMDYIKTRKYKEDYNPYIREIKFFDINIREESLPEFLKDMKPFHGAGHLENVANKMKTMIRLVSRGAIESVDMDKVPIGVKYPIARPCYCHIIGIARDKRDRFGLEAI